MSLVSDIDEETLDLRWFAVDPAGRLGMFMSGGRGFLPNSIKSSREDLQAVSAALTLSLPILGTFKDGAGLTTYMQFDSGVPKSVSIAGFGKFSERGFYCFDCIYLPIRPSGYFSITVPQVPLLAASLPPAILNLVNRTACNRCFTDSVTLSESDFSSAAQQGRIPP